MQARLETRRDSSRYVAIVFAMMVVIALGVASAYALTALSAPATHSVQSGAAQTGHGPDSDLTRALPVAPAAHGPNSDLTRALPVVQKASGPIIVSKAGTSDCDYINRHKAC